MMHSAKLMGTAYFFAAILDKAFPAKSRIFTPKMNEIRDKFQSDTRLLVDLDYLFQIVRYDG